MAIIVDTEVIIAGERGKLDLPEWVESCGEETVQLAAITLAELWHGVERGAEGLKSYSAALAGFNQPERRNLRG